MYDNGLIPLYSRAAMESSPLAIELQTYICSRNRSALQGHRPVRRFCPS